MAKRPGRLIDQTGGKVIFTGKQCFLVIKGKSEALGVRDASGLYVVNNAQYQLGNCVASALVGNAISTDLARERITTLHRAFGHAGKKRLQTLIRKHKFRGITEEHVKLLQPCEACMLGKAHRAAEGRVSKVKSDEFGARLCADCSGPFRNKSIGGNSYLLVIVDEHTAWTWAVPLASLKQVYEHLERLIEVQLHQRDDTVVRFYRSDGGAEFQNNRTDTLLAKHGIEREVTCASSSHQNGKAERRIRTIFEGVRTCLSDAGLPVGF